MKLAALVALLAAIPAGAAAQNKSPRDPIVQVGLFGYRADGLIGGAAYDTWPDLTSTVYVSMARCGMGAGNRKPPDDASDIWQFAGKVLSVTPSRPGSARLAAMVAQGRRMDGNESSQQLTLRAGEACSSTRRVSSGSRVVRPWPLASRRDTRHAFFPCWGRAAVSDV